MSIEDEVKGTDFAPMMKKVRSAFGFHGPGRNPKQRLRNAPVLLSLTLIRLEHRLEAAMSVCRCRGEASTRKLIRANSIQVGRHCAGVFLPNL